ncbi:putative WD repeat-containing protein 76 [Apostichopus japonicus]|uniref:WD repeat-containing protein 76 n=1 Tax=Stichopus japonicus TaxID=307972 RepID=A0A2G8KG84_STIJA|nr:putative WD repeat-containing protein 76 [Apostichopus japonicus]
MKKTVDSQRNVSLPPNSFYKFSLPSRTMAPTLRQRNKALEQVDVNKNTGTGSTTSRTAKKMKTAKHEESKVFDFDAAGQAASRRQPARASKLVKKSLDENQDVKIKKEVDDREVKPMSSEMSDYEAKRLKNIEENAKFFASLGIFQAKDELTASTETKRKKIVRGLKPDKERTAPLPKRAPSLRLQGKTPEGSEIPGHAGLQTTLFQYQPFEDRVQERHPEGPLDMECTNVKKETKAEGVDFITNLAKMSSTVEEPTKELGADAASLLKKLQSLVISERRVAKVVPHRIFSVGFHPLSDRTIVAAGDKWGSLGFWDLDSSEGDDGVFLFSPHTRPINCLSFSPSQPAKVFTCSYDGTVRCGDFEKGIFDEIYATDEDSYYDSMLHCFDFLDRSGSNLLIAQNEGGGHVTTIDTRSPGRIGEKLFRLHDKNIRTVSVHPLKQQYFITASTDCHIALWDVRKLNSNGRSKSVCELPHGKGVNSAFFSPITGSKILSTCADDKLRIYQLEETTEAVADVSLASSRHHNNHTGRWLTKFRAEWHPRCEEIFIVGSMARPRQVRHQGWIAPIILGCEPVNVQKLVLREVRPDEGEIWGDGFKRG